MGGTHWSRKIMNDSVKERVERMRLLLANPSLRMCECTHNMSDHSLKGCDRIYCECKQFKAIADNQVAGG